jgi:hypothetical protein
MLTVLYCALVVYVVAIAFDFATGLIDLWSKHFNKPQQSINYFPEVDSCNTLKVANTTESLSQSRVGELAVLGIGTQAEASVETLTAAIDALPSTVRELRLLAQQRHIRGARSMRKDQLLAVLQ